MIQKKNNLYLKTSFLFIFFFWIHYSSFGQFTDTTNTRQDTDLVNWAEDYIVKTGYIKKTKQGFEYGSSYTPTLNGRYSLHVIEKQQMDTALIILYRMQAGSNSNFPVVVKRLIKKDGKSEFQVIGRVQNLDCVHQLYLLFELYKFSTGTQLYCYKMLLQNYDLHKDNVH